jgi:single-strand DNA-binding protein
MNKCHLIGNLTADPQIRYTQSGKAVARFTLAIDDGYGENKRTDFPTIIVWGKTAETIGNNLHKGSKVAVNGKITTSSYEKNGQKLYTTEVTADMYGGVEFLDKKQGGSQSSSTDGLPAAPDITEEIPF